MIGYRPFSQALATLFAAFSLLLSVQAIAGTEPLWTSPNHYRVLLSMNTNSNNDRRNSPAAADIYFADIIASVGGVGTFDENTIEVVTYDDTTGVPRVFDPSRIGNEKYLLPWRVQNYYDTNQVTLSFVMPDETCTKYAVYFDTIESELGKPSRYHGLVGDGDWFREDYGKRAINANRYDTWCDIDNDGDLDLFKGGTEPYVYVYENVTGHSPNGNLYVDRGRLTSGGTLLVFPMDGNNRSWLSVQFCDWDKDGDQDMFIHSPTGLYASEIICYENTTPSGGQIRFAAPFVIRTQDNNKLGSGGGATMTFVDWNGDGKTDLLLGRDTRIEYHQNVGTDDNIGNIKLAETIYLTANAVDIQLHSPCADCVDIDDDGDLDMFVGTEGGQIFWFENVGSRQAPLLTLGRMIAIYTGGYTANAARVKVHDFDGDGLLDFVVGRYWENIHWGEQGKQYGCLYKNIGTKTSPKFATRDIDNGCPYTNRFQICDAMRQNGVRAVDWNNDGRTDLIAGDEDGFVCYFHNKTNHLFPVFDTGIKLKAGPDGKFVKVIGEEDLRVRDGYARPEICDWNSDGLQDLLVADGRGWLWLYLCEGFDEDSEPILKTGTRVYANDRPIDGTARSSVLVCDWNNDGKKDVIFGMVGEENPSEYYDWPVLTDVSQRGNESGFLFFRNTAASSTATPILARPTWVKSGNPADEIRFTRPNLGDYVDWDGDGDKDFIGCEFEHNIRLYRNAASGASGVEPIFDSPSSGAGEMLVVPFTVQMISGADAFDWNRDWDGDPNRNLDIDILTGQGHGGSGLRFYERDFIKDTNAGTLPIPSLGSSEHRLTIPEAKPLANNAIITVPDVIVTAVFTGYFYVESENRESGIRVNWLGTMPSIGQKLNVSGTLSTNSNGERCINATSIK